MKNVLWNARIVLTIISVAFVPLTLFSETMTPKEKFYSCLLTAMAVIWTAEEAMNRRLKHG